MYKQKDDAEEERGEGGTGEIMRKELFVELEVSASGQKKNTNKQTKNLLTGKI